MTLYMASSHPDHPDTTGPGDYLPRTSGAHRRRNSRSWNSMTRWIRVPTPRKVSN